MFVAIVNIFPNISLEAWTPEEFGIILAQLVKHVEDRKGAGKNTVLDALIAASRKVCNILILI